LRTSSLLQVEVRLSIKAALLPDPVLFLLGRDDLDNIKCIQLRVPDHLSKITFSDAATGRAPGGTARYFDNGLRGKLFLPLDLFSETRPLYVKLLRPRLFFDEAGWTEIPLLRPAEQLAAPDRNVADRALERLAHQPTHPTRARRRLRGKARTEAAELFTVSSTVSHFLAAKQRNSARRGANPECRIT
jgi:hypothetical protein